MATLHKLWLSLTRGVAKPVMALLLLQLLSGAWILSQGSFFPIYLEEQSGYAPLAVASIIAIGQASGMVAGLLGGVLSDTLGSKRVLVLGLLGGVIASFVFQTRLPLLIAILWGLAGAAGSLQTLGGSSYLTRMADSQRLGVLSALYALSLTLGGALGGPASGRLLDTAGFRVYGLVGLSLIAFTALLAVTLLPAQAVHSHEPGTNQARSSMLELAGRPVVRRLIALRFLPTLYYGVSVVFIPLMINRIAGNKTTVAIYGTASLIVASAAQLLTGRAADRFGHRWPTLVGYGALIGAAVGLAAFAGQLWGVVVFGILGTAVAWSLASLQFCLVADGVPRAEHGRTLGLLHATWNIAMMGGAMLGGALTRISAGLPFLVAGLLNSVSLAVALAFFAHLGREGTAGAEAHTQELKPATPQGLVPEE